MLRSLKAEEKDLILEDPVRPHIPYEKRFENGRNIIVLEENNTVSAIVCVALTNAIPITEQEMFDMADPNGDICIAYTVWSYSKGAGRRIINQLRDNAQELGALNRMVTLSPLTEMAERFHISNGATLLRRGEQCQNFEYPL